MSTKSVFGLMRASSMGVTLLLLAGLSFTGACIVLIMATPPLVLVSPILVPAGIATFLIISGFYLSDAICGLGLVVLLWVYNYVSGNHPFGADKLDSAMEKIGNKVGEVKYKTQMYGQHGQFAEFGI